MTLTLKNRRLSAGSLSPQPETVKKIQGLAPAIILVTKNGSIFEMTTEFGGKMLEMVFVLIRYFFGGITF